ncbi:MAG: hypothetical protein ACLFQV_11535 [Vulcanimicrobiota bacterium]
MDYNFSKFKLNINTGEVEIEGNEKFVDKQLSNLGNILETAILKFDRKFDKKPDEIKVKKKVSKTTKHKKSDHKKNKKIKTQQNKPENTKPQVSSPYPVKFKTWYDRLQKKEEGEPEKSDIVLLASFYVQSQNPVDKTFSTREVNQVLKENDFKIKARGQIGYLNREDKIEVARKGKRGNFYRVTDVQEDRLKKVLLNSRN